MRLLCELGASLIKRKDVRKGIFAPNENVTVKWKGRCYEAKIISVGKETKLIDNISITSLRDFLFIQEIILK